MGRSCPARVPPSYAPSFRKRNTGRLRPRSLAKKSTERPSSLARTLVARVSRAQSFINDCDPPTSRRRSGLRAPSSEPRIAAPFVDGTAKGMSSWVMTEARIAATARDAAKQSSHCSELRRDRRIECAGSSCPCSRAAGPSSRRCTSRRSTKLVALPPAIPDVPDPEWDIGLEKPRIVGRDWNAHRARWTITEREGETATGPSGTTGRLVQLDRRHALIVEDGRPVRTRALHLHAQAAT